MKNFFTTVVVLFASALLVHAAGKTAIKSPLFQGDADAGGNNITNVVDILDPNGNSLLGGGGGGGISTTTATNIAKDLISKSNLNVTVPEISAATNAVVSSLGSSAFVNTNRFAQTNNPTIFSANLRSAVIPDVLTLQSGSSLNFSDGQPIITAGGYIMWGNGTRAQSEFGSRLWYGGGSFQSGQGDLWDFTGYEFMYPDGSVDFTHGSTNVFAGDGTALTLATNNSTASDGWLLSKTGNHYKLIASAAGGSWTGALGNWQVWTNTDGSLYFSNTVGGVSFVIPTNGLPVTTNYPQLSTNFNWSQGQIAVFSGQTNSVTGSPIFVPTNMPTSALVQSNLYVRDTNGLILDFAKAQTFNVGILTNGNLWISNVNTITNLACHDVQINLHQWTNGSAKLLTLKNAFGGLTTNGAWTQTTNANATDILVARVDATGTNVVVTPQTNASSYSDTNSLLTAGGGGGGGNTFTLIDNQVAVASGVTEATVTLNTTGAKLVVVGVCNYDGAGGGTDEDPIHSGDTYTGLTKIGAPTGGHYTNQLFYCVSPAQSASYTIKVKHSYIVVCAASFSYSGTTPALDTQAAGNGSSSFTTIQPGSASPASTGLFVTSLTWSAGSSSATADSSFTLLNRTQEGTDPLYGGMWYKSSSSAENPTLTAPATSFGATTMAVFK